MYNFRLVAPVFLSVPCCRVLPTARYLDHQWRFSERALAAWAIPVRL
jgi:hypothetical protein